MTPSAATSPTAPAATEGEPGCARAVEGQRGANVSNVEVARFRNWRAAASRLTLQNEARPYVAGHIEGAMTDRSFIPAWIGRRWRVIATCLMAALAAVMIALV